MREIKFRLIKNGKIVGYEIHGLVTSGDDGIIILHSIYANWEKVGEYYNIAVYPNKYIPHDAKEQFIGRKGKDSVDIYEGDDVDVSMSFEGGTLPHRGVIVYDNVFGAFGTKNEAGITLLHNHCLHTLEVIGTIHDEEQPNG